ncbi:MAG: hypothetical protein AAGN64_12865 [Bacteroidota bacterium]
MRAAFLQQPRSAYLAALTLATLSTLFLFVVSLGVGIIGADGDPANLLYLSVIALGVVGSIVARFRSEAMVVVLAAMALVQAGIGLYAIVAGLGRPYSGALELIGLTVLFVALFLTAAWLFRQAARSTTATHA